MTGVVSLDGQLVPLDSALVPIVDRGFLYGDAVFEALRTYHGEPDALMQHLQRLQRSCGILGMTLPVSLTQLADEVRVAVAAVDVPERYVRIMVTRGDSPESLSPVGAQLPRRAVIVRPLPTSPAASSQEGIRVVTQQAPPSPLWAGAKPSAYLANLLAVANAAKAGADDALLLGLSGELLEGATSSVFLVRAGEILTPPLSLGILPGITRDRIFLVAEGLGLGVRERLLTVHDAYRADELFLTSSVRTVVGVVAVDGVVVSDGSPGPVTQRIARAYRAHVGLT